MAETDIDLEVEPTPATGKSKIILFLVGALLLVGGGGAAWFFLFSSGDQRAVESAEAPSVSQGPVQYVNISPSFIVNFPHQGRQRFLQADISLMSRDAQALEAAQLHMPIIRHNLISLFNAQLLLVFEDPSGVERLRQLATEEVQRVLRQEIGRDGIEQVLFTSFVMQ